MSYPHESDAAAGIFDNEGTRSRAANLERSARSLDLDWWRLEVSSRPSGSAAEALGAGLAVLRTRAAWQNWWTVTLPELRAIQDRGSVSNWFGDADVRLAQRERELEGWRGQYAAAAAITAGGAVPPPGEPTSPAVPNFGETAASLQGVTIAPPLLLLAGVLTAGAVLVAVLRPAPSAGKR